MRALQPGTLALAGLVAGAAFPLIWLVVHFTLPDEWRIVFLANALAFYLFLPLPVLALLAVAGRHRVILCVVAFELTLALFNWGPLYLPNDTQPANGRTLSVATYNSLGYNMDAARAVESIRRLDADFVALQELNPEVAAEIDLRLASTYPYRALLPQAGTRGMGVISKLPFVEAGETISDDAWVGQPQIVRVQFEGREVTVANFHASAPLRPAERMDQAAKIVDFVRRHDGPIVIAGDFNSSSTNAVYSELRSVLHDAWLDAGFGLGNTFPGASKTTTPGSARPAIGPISVPPWLVRIDYVFYTGKHWRAVDASLGDHGGSDHRPVKAVLAPTPVP